MGPVASIPVPAARDMARGVPDAEGSSDVTPAVRYDSLDGACTVAYRRRVRLLTLHCRPAVLSRLHAFRGTTR
jgi:hypothetical protein